MGDYLDGVVLGICIGVTLCALIFWGIAPLLGAI